MRTVLNSTFFLNIDVSKKQGQTLFPYQNTQCKVVKTIEIQKF